MGTGISFVRCRGHSCVCVAFYGLPVEQAFEGRGEESGDVGGEVDRPLDHEPPNEAVDDDREVVRGERGLDTQLGALVDEKVGELDSSGQMDVAQTLAELGV